MGSAASAQSGGGKQRPSKKRIQKSDNGGQKAVAPAKAQPNSKSASTASSSRSIAGRAVGQEAVEQVKQAISEGDASFTLEDLKKVVGASVKISDSELQQLFEEVDTDKDGKVTKEQFLDGLRATPSVNGLKTLSSLLKSSGALDIFAHHILESMQRRLGPSSDVAVDTILQKARSEDIREGLRRAEEEIVSAVVKDLDRMQATEDAAVSTFNDKFAYDSETFEGVYLDVLQFRDGVEGALGLPGKDVYEGMKMEFCHSADSKKVFRVSNYDTATTPEREWEFVVSPDMDKDYGGERRPVPLRVLLLACSAKKANAMDERWDTPLAQLSADERDGVMVVLLRRVKEAGMANSFLAAAAEADERLRRLACLSEQELGQLREALSAALKSTPCNPATGQPGLEAVLARLEAAQVAREEAEALAEAMRCKVREASLSEEEVVALRLYTGPAFKKINETLRERDGGQDGNNYVSVIFAAISGMVKVADITPIPVGRTVYRGQKGMRLPRRFWEGNAQGVKGGVEMAFLSTTTSFHVAKQYAAAGVLPTVFAIQVGAVDKGAALGFLSQYAEEEEILMPPRSFLEVVDEPTVLGGEGGMVLSIPVKINCNLLCPTLEKLHQSRKTMLVSALQHVRKEVVRDVEAMAKSDAVKARGKGDIFWKYAARRREFLQSIKDEGVRLLAAVNQRPATWYNTDMYFRRAMQQALDLHRISMGKLQLWVEERKLYITHLSKLSAQDCERKAAGRLRRLMEEAEEAMAAGSKEAGAELQALAKRLCKQQELIDEDVDEVVEGQTALMVHAAAGNLQAVRLLLAAGADARMARADGMSALIFAAQAGHAEVVRLLVHHGGADPNARDEGVDGGRTPLIHAAENGHTGTAETLLRECGADPSLTISSGQQRGDTAAYRAAYFGFERTLRKIMEHARADSRDLTPPKDNGWTAAMAAAQNGHLGVLKWVVQAAGQDVNAANADGKTALMLAATQGHGDNVRWLVEEGAADVAVVDKNGANALMLAVQKGLKSNVALLLADGRIDVNAADSRGRTALMLAAGAGFQGCVELLVKGGARVAAVDKEECTALMLAAEQGHQQTVEWLVTEAQADVRHLNSRRGWTMALVAAEKGHLPTLQFLVQHGADPLARNDYGATALMLAAGEGQQETVEWLLASSDIDAELQDRMGWTALHYALYINNSALVELLLASGGGGDSEQGRQARLEQAGGEVEAYQRRGLRVERGLPWKVWLDAERRTAKFTSFTSLRLKACCPQPCKAYYELEVLEELFCPQFGFATAKFKAARKRSPFGVGDDAQSWGVDGQRGRRYHEGAVEAYAVTWRVGDVVGLACDLPNLQILVSVNGDFAPPNGVAFTLAAELGVEELFAALSALSGAVRYNFGEHVPFAHSPPSSDFVPIARAAAAPSG